jgi:hypothetical protein
MKRTHSQAALVLAAAAVIAGSLQPMAAAADPSDRWILAGDQAGPRLVAFDPAVTDWDDPAAIRWEWEPTTALGFSAAEIAAFRNVTDFKLRDTPQGQRIVLTASYGLAAVISYPEGVRQWARVLPLSDNLHSGELLPNGNVAITSTNTSTGYVRVYAASQGPNASHYAQYSLNAQSHGSLWDPITERLWIVGKQGSGASDPRIITALSVTGTPAAPRLNEDDRKWFELPDIGSHDLTADPNDPNALLISTNDYTYEVDKTVSTNPFTELGATSGSLPRVKAISRQPSGQTVQTRPDEYKTPKGACAAVNYWCTDTVDFYGPDMTRTVTGAQFYRAKALWGEYNAAGNHLHGELSVRVKAGSGGWGSPGVVDPSTEITAIAAAAAPDGRVHAQYVVPGDGVWARTRSAAGAWSAATKIDANAAVTDVSSTVRPDGTVHVQTLIPGQGVWDRTRSTAGVWSAATKIDSNASIVDISSAALPNGNVHVQALVAGTGIYNRVLASGSWSTSSKIADGCEGTSVNDPCVAQISAAGLPDGTVQVQALTPAAGVSNLSRSTTGAWSMPVQIDSNDAITRISAAAAPDGTLNVQTVVPGFGIWNRARTAAGVWPGSVQIDSSETSFAVFGAVSSVGELIVGDLGYAF